METNASRRSPGRGPGIGLALWIGRAFDIARLYPPFTGRALERDTIPAPIPGLTGRVGAAWRFPAGAL